MTYGPGVESREPIFRHLDDPDVPWQEVKRQRNADGSTIPRSTGPRGCVTSVATGHRMPEVRGTMHR